MSKLHVDRFSESMTIENYDNEGVESYYKMFDSDSAVVVTHSDSVAKYAKRIVK